MKLPAPIVCFGTVVDKRKNLSLATRPLVVVERFNSYIGIIMAEKKKHLKVTLVKSTNKKLACHKACARGLGLRRLGSSAKVNDTPENRGMINKINFLLTVEEV